MKYGNLTYLSKEGRVLMMEKESRENDPNSGKYSLPGGNLEDYEKGLKVSKGRLESAVREFKEETGLDLIDPIFRGTILFDNRNRVFDNWPNPTDFLVYLYSASNYGDRGILVSGSKGESPVWVPEKDILNLPKNSGDRFIYEWLSDGRFFTGVIRHKGKEVDESKTWVDYF